jgi:hypothetical protein
MSKLRGFKVRRYVKLRSNLGVQSEVKKKKKMSKKKKNRVLLPIYKGRRVADLFCHGFVVSSVRF